MAIGNRMNTYVNRSVYLNLTVRTKIGKMVNFVNVPNSFQAFSLGQVKGLQIRLRGQNPPTPIITLELRHVFVFNSS